MLSSIRNFKGFASLVGDVSPQITKISYYLRYHNPTAYYFKNKDDSQYDALLRIRHETAISYPQLHFSSKQEFIIYLASTIPMNLIEILNSNNQFYNMMISGTCVEGDQNFSDVKIFLETLRKRPWNLGLFGTLCCGAAHILSCLVGVAFVCVTLPIVPFNQNISKYAWQAGIFVSHKTIGNLASLCWAALWVGVNYSYYVTFYKTEIIVSGVFVGSMYVAAYCNTRSHPGAPWIGSKGRQPNPHPTKDDGSDAFMDTAGTPPPEIEVPEQASLNEIEQMRALAQIEGNSELKKAWDIYFDLQNTPTEQVLKTEYHVLMLALHPDKAIQNNKDRDLTVVVQFIEKQKKYWANRHQKLKLAADRALRESTSNQSSVLCLTMD